ncbi:MAG TPA: DUF4124 domain-containing protein [Rhodocyclaceae bacterium]|nr:DUF4124 domain-containing protein [Rhodocyclaceae bacterium]
MKTVCTIALCLAASLQLSPASAQVYQWKDASGRTIISDSPPPSAAKGSRTVATDMQPGSGGSAPKSYVEKDMDFKKRQQEAQKKSENDAKEQAAAADRKNSCDRARSQLASLESGERLMMRDESGERRYLDDAQRQQEIENARRVMAASCK